MKYICQYIYDVLSQNRNKKSSLYIRWFFTRCRTLILKFYNPLVTHCIGDCCIKLRFDHGLGVIRGMYPSYATNLGRIALVISKEIPRLTIIDIGANVGDTIAFLRQCVASPILAIEGEKAYIQLLKENVRGLSNVEISENFVGVANGFEYTKRNDGSGHMVVAEKNHIANALSFREILVNHPLFNQTKLLKIDTDGFDTKIIKESIGWISEHRPVIFFEYDPAHFLRVGENGFEVFDILKNNNYEYFIIYNNFGEYMYSGSLFNNNLLEDMHNSFLGRNTEFFADICVFSKDDEKIFSEVRKQELSRRTSLS